MKKTSRIMGAVGLSCALALGTAVPAFAADPAVVDSYGENKTAVVNGSVDFEAVNEAGENEGKVTVDENGNGTFNPVGDQAGSTQVRVLSEITQINATVPMVVYVVANNMGGDLLAVPTGTGANTLKDGDFSGYRIENGSVTDLFVTNVKASDAQADNAVNGKFSYSDTAVSKTTTVPSGKTGVINLKVTPYVSGASAGTAPEVIDLTSALTVGENQNASAVGNDIASKFAAGGADSNKVVFAKNGSTYYKITGIWNSTFSQYSFNVESATEADTQAPTAAATAGTEVTITSAGTALKGDDWKVAAATFADGEMTTPGVVGLQLGGTTSMINRDAALTMDGVAGEYTGNVGDVQLTYTISATAPAGA